MKTLLSVIAKGFMKFMSQKDVQYLAIDLALWLSKQTKFTWDDEAVEALATLFRKYEAKK